ncbi:MAG TPA: transcription-repair coupling factor, partial [Clostridiales bacterium]|nr:transcription-repair coupling factor [Clostridiales bacterium]
EGARQVKLSRLGSAEWEKTKNRVRKSVKDMAKQLLALYAKRVSTKGFAFSKDIDMQNDFERRFEFEETEDQLRCVNEIKNDMEQPYPMDRLLCGDVGFGKTEVALRAAFKCVADGKQCAILVPTTILALQHYQTILKRFEGFPITAEMLSRFRTPKEQEAIKKGLKRGSIDIVVGTHSIIANSVEFKDLGLLIIDEEQRFGVEQKEKLKERFPAVDCLTISATPIPRTLNMAMSGIRDMSIIEEAPQDRQPVQTYVLEHDMGILAEAMAKELRRGGQVYYVHNRIETIERTALRIKEYLPDARIEIAHGKMSESVLSDIWRRLIEGEIDILVCTTIIETGVDVPNVNTLIIENADHMGLAQLHQMRGRVGRSSRRASAYFTFVKGKELSETAYRRLSAIREYTEFGSGFKIAMRDLEIRGAGDLLGASQHGHMEAVGYDLYLKLLAQEVSKEKGEETEVKTEECLIDLQVDAHIPEKYIESVPQRLSIYRRIAEIKNQDDADDVLDELTDRFGDPPDAVMGLIKISMLRNAAARLGIYEVGQRGDSLLLFTPETDMTMVSKLANGLKGRIFVSAAKKPYISVRRLKNQGPLEALEEIINVLTKPEPEGEKKE